MGRRLSVNAVLFFDLIDLRRRSGQADDRRIEQGRILADLLRAVVAGSMVTKRMSRASSPPACSRSLTKRASVVGQTSPQRVKPK